MKSKHSRKTSSKTVPEAQPPKGWFERPSNVRAMVVGLVVACMALAFADLFYENPHPHFDIETSFAFQAWFGFVTFVVIVFVGSGLRGFLSRPENYYDSGDDDAGA